MRRALPILAVVVIVALVAGGLTQAGGGTEDPAAPAGERFDLAGARERLRGAPEPLAALHEQSNQLLGGGRPAFEARMRELEGHPVVINKWASWCGPCRAEFPILQALSTERGREVAFLGLDSRDKRGAATRFLADFPVPYPSYEDPGEEIARALRVPKNFPVTVFVEASGRTAFVHHGGYRSEADLAADVDRLLG